MNRRTALRTMGGCFVAALGCKGANSTAPKPQLPSPKENKKLASDNNEFAFDLYAKAREAEGNLFFSPASISTALAMTYAGARGSTADEMAKVMHFNLGQSELHPAFAGLLRELNGDGADAKRGYQLSVANALWGQNGFPWKQEFLKLTNDNYRAGLRQVDFAKSEEARKTINDWVEKETHEKIKDLIPSGSLDAMTRLVLTNAIYFKGDWAVQFKKDATFNQNFLVSANKNVSLPMMHRTGEYRIFENEELQMLDLPYQGKELSMLVLLPRRANGLAALEKNLSAAKLDEYAKKLRTENELAVALPKFKIEHKLPLTSTLQGMGMKDAFGPGVANFSGMTDADRLHISQVLHKAFVEVNEEGTEAAAATAVIMKRASAVGTAFRADHPFVFAIRDNRSGSVLFLGRVADPSK